MHELPPTLTFALALAAGVLAQVLGKHLRIPSIVLFFLLGVGLGPEGLHWLHPDALGEGLFGLVELAVAVILFEGGLSLDVRRLRREERSIRRLLSLGVIITATGATVAAQQILGWSWGVAAIYGGLMVVTGPTVIRPLLRQVPVKRRIANLLEAEGLLSDPIGAILAAVALQAVVAPVFWSTAFGAALGAFVVRAAFGLIAGLVFGFCLGWLLRARWVEQEGLANLITLGSVLLFFELCDLALSESGILAVTVAGIVLANMATPVDDELKEFEERLTMLLIGTVFVLLAADVELLGMRTMGMAGIVTILVLSFVIRPVAVTASLWRNGWPAREKGYLVWLAPRGIVAAAVASLAAARLQQNGIAEGEALRSLVFLTIAFTVFVQGGLAPVAAWALGVRQRGRDSAIVLGAHGLGRALATLLQKHEVPVMLIDSNPNHVRSAEEAQLPVIFGNGLEERTIARARGELAQWAVGLTANEQANSLFAREAAERFGVPHAYAALETTDTGVTSEFLTRQGSLLFGSGSTDVERWNTRLRHGLAKLTLFEFDPAALEEAAGETKGALPADPSFLMLAYRRRDKFQLVSGDYRPQVADFAYVLIHADEAESAMDKLAAAGWRHVKDEDAETETVGADVTAFPAEG